MTPRTVSHLLAPVFAAALAAPRAVSAAIHWTFSAGANGLSGGSAVFDPDGVPAPYTFTAGGIDVQVEGWADQGSNTLLNDYVVRTWSGLGVDRPGENNPQHGVDNSGPDEWVLFKFTENGSEKKVTLQEVGLGWFDTDADLSVDISGSVNPILAGEALTYTVDVENLGPETAVGTLATVNLPDDVSRLGPWQRSTCLTT